MLLSTGLANDEEFSHHGAALRPFALQIILSFSMVVRRLILGSGRSVQGEGRLGSLTEVTAAQWARAARGTA